MRKRLMYSLVLTWSLVHLAAHIGGCKASAAVQKRPGFEVSELREKQIVLMPLAITSDLGDDRTGIVLDYGSVRDSGMAACEHARESFAHVTIKCFHDRSLIASRPVLNDLLLRFARNQPIPAQTCQALSKGSGAAFALLFRPERVTATREGATGGAPNSHDVPLSQSYNPNASWTANVAGNAIGNMLGGLLVLALTGDGGAGRTTTTRSYAVSAILVDLRSCEAVAAGARVSTGKRASEEHPAPAPILTEAMTALSSAIIDD